MDYFFQSPFLSTSCEIWEYVKNLCVIPSEEICKPKNGIFRSVVIDIDVCDFDRAFNLPLTFHADVLLMLPSFSLKVWAGEQKRGAFLRRKPASPLKSPPHPALSLRGRGIIRAGGAAWDPGGAEEPTAESAGLRRRKALSTSG